MSEILTAVLVLCVIGFVGALLLVIASRYMKVPENETFPRLRECLPGANCGSCGYAGCDGYAKALSEGAESRTNLCVPGADAAAAKIAAVLGVAAQDVEELSAVVACRGDRACTGARADYRGVASCAAAKQLYGGPGRCVHGCLGFGDCAAVCPKEAVSVADGLARINPRLCIGCGLCAKTCPNGVILLVPETAATAVRCRSTEPGAAARKACAAACIGCGRCERECPAGAITVKNNLASIDYARCTRCGRCAEVCPTGAAGPADLRRADV